MGFFDNASQYFDSPNVSSGYSGMDSGGGDYWSQSFSDVSSGSDNFFSSLNDDSFWDTSDTWNQSYDALFATQPDFNMDNIWSNEEYQYGLDNSGGGFLGGVKDFLGSRGGLSLLGSALGAGLKYAGDRSNRSDLLANRDADRAAAARQRELDRQHEQHMLEMKLAAEAAMQQEQWHPREKQPGKADKTTSALADKPVKWS
jgi:hypothetical protein